MQPVYLIFFAEAAASAFYVTGVDSEYALDEIIRVISGDGFVSLTVITSRGLTERARIIHGCSPVSTAALGRVMAAASMLGSSIKKDGASLTVRIAGGGPIGSIIAVSDAYGNVRCTAGNPAADLPTRERDGKLDVGGIVGCDGTISVIRDMGSGEPFTGSTALVSGEIAEDFTAYLHISEQIPSACALGVLVDRDRTVRAAGGYLASLLPGAPYEIAAVLEANVAAAGSVTSILDGGSVEDIIACVMRGLEPRVLERTSVQYKCYCSHERVARALSSLGEAEINDILHKDETLEITCRFCDEVYRFTPDEIKELNR